MKKKEGIKLRHILLVAGAVAVIAAMSSKPKKKQQLSGGELFQQMKTRPKVPPKEEIDPSSVQIVKDVKSLLVGIRDAFSRWLAGGGAVAEVDIDGPVRDLDEQFLLLNDKMVANLSSEKGGVPELAKGGS